MCVQCMAAAMVSGSAASGTRIWLVSRRFSWLTPKRLKRVTIVLLASALIASALFSSGSTQATQATGAAAGPPPAAAP